MRLIDMPAFWAVLADCVAWFIIHMGVSLCTLHLPDCWFDRDTFLYRIRSWEQSGLFWQRSFRVRSWKHRLPDGAAILKKGFAKKQMKASNPAWLSLFIRESRRAELTHWIIMPFSLLFFLWNPPAVGWFMILYAVIMNLPCIIAQRFNRPRFQHILKQRQKA
ncbi:MAG: glycosyl-4,4'-diaponeurosporenoate acyltransferase [Bacillota bacterium]|nr:glycosyl-4,4'-diaponeurosporenoate acyltransferase [Bacillota bacterium]